eukprot:692106_1
MRIWYYGARKRVKIMVTIQIQSNGHHIRILRIRIIRLVSLDRFLCILITGLDWKNVSDIMSDMVLCLRPALDLFHFPFITVTISTNATTHISNHKLSRAVVN